MATPLLPWQPVPTLDNPSTGDPSTYHTGFSAVRPRVWACTQMQKEVLSQAEAGAVSSRSSEAATAPARQEDLLDGSHAASQQDCPCPSPSSCCRHRSGRVAKHSQPAAALPLLRTTSSGSRATSNWLNTLWQCLHQAVIPSKGQKSSPGIPEIQLLPQNNLALWRSLSPSDADVQTVTE